MGLFPSCLWSSGSSDCGAIILVAAGPVGYFGWMGFVNVTRVEFLRARNFEYVKAARALGLKDGKIMRRRMLPNAFIGPISFLPFVFAGSVTILSTYDFWGLACPPRIHPWGKWSRPLPGNLPIGGRWRAWLYPLSTLTLLFVLWAMAFARPLIPGHLYRHHLATGRER